MIERNVKTTSLENERFLRLDFPPFNLEGTDDFRWPTRDGGGGAAVEQKEFYLNFNRPI
jgi:hypothetical protein